MISPTRLCKLEISFASGSANSKSTPKNESQFSLDKPVEYIGNDNFEHADNKEIDFDELRELEMAGSSPGRKTPIAKLPEHLLRLCQTPLLSADQEARMFRSMNFLKHQAEQLRLEIQSMVRPGKRLAKLKTLLGQADRFRNVLVRANIRLVISVVKKFVSPQFAFDELLSDGIITLMATVEKFDYSRGFRFSTYAYRSISRNAYRAVTDRQSEMSRIAIDADHRFEVEDRSITSSMDEKTWEHQRTVLQRLMNDLNPREQFILQGRYALDQNHKIRTFQSLADQLGVSKERVRQLAHRAVSKLKTMADNMALEEPVVSPT